MFAPSPQTAGEDKAGVHAGAGAFLYRPMARAVAFAMIAAYLLSRTFIPSRSARWLRVHSGHDGGHRARGARAFDAWEILIDCGIDAYARALDVVLRNRVVTVGQAAALMAATLFSIGPRLRREFFPEVDAGAFEIYSEIGVVADLSAAYTPNAGPMDAVVRVQLTYDRKQTAQRRVQDLRAGFASDPRFADLEFAFDAGGMIRAAMNQGRSSPINIRASAKDPVKFRAIAESARRRIALVDGVVDARIIERLDYPQMVRDRTDEPGRVDRHQKSPDPSFD
jgi:hypothetical protein